MKSATISIKKHFQTVASSKIVYTTIFVIHFFVFLTIFPKNASPQPWNAETARNPNAQDGDRAVAACSNLNFVPRRFYFQDGVHSDSCQRAMADWLDDIDRDVREFNVLTSDFAWGVSVDPDNPKLAGRGAVLDKARSKWRRDLCGKVGRLDAGMLSASQRQQLSFLCKGATLNPQESESLGVVLDEMQSLYTTSKICIPTSEDKNPEKQDDESDILLFLREIDDILSNRELCQNGVQSCNTIEKVSSEVNLEKRNAHFDNHKENNDNQINEEIDDTRTHFDDAVSIAAKMAADFENSEETFDGICFSGEPDLERMMARSRDEAVLRWAWLAWRERTGPPARPLYQKMVEVKNAAARRSGYSDLGEIWREELETPNLEGLVDDLLGEVSRLYRTLHGVVRFFLRRRYGPDVVSEKGPIPAHLLGNMWAQNWETILDLILPKAREADLDKIIKNTNWTTHDMLKRAEDFYTSIGLFPMTEKFWKYSYFGDGGEEERRNRTAEERRARGAKCHGTAANMFLPGDYRMIYCAGLSMEDFYVIHHEMGHIEYYMSYDPRLPTIFQDGANSAFQESVGDAIMYAVLTPQHLQRLGLIKDNLVYSKNQNQQAIVENSINSYSVEGVRRNKRDTTDDERVVKNVDKEHLNGGHRRGKSLVKKRSTNLRIDKLERNIDGGVPQDFEMSPTFYSKDDPHTVNMNPDEESDDDHDVDFDTILLLRQALTKLPQIPFGYIIDKYRWDIFSGKIKPRDYNKAFWDYVTEYQGIEPPSGEDRSEYYFDAAAKFHVPDNTPYVRYFLSSFLQVQMFRGLCQWSLFGQAGPGLRVPMPLHRCDIYGSKKAGRKLREMMSRGSSIHWSEALFILTGDRTVSSSALHEYFAPLKGILRKLITKHNIPLGW